MYLHTFPYVVNYVHFLYVIAHLPVVYVLLFILLLLLLFCF